MAHIMIGRLRPSSTDPELLFTTPDNGLDPKITSIIVTKVLDITTDYTIYYNPNGVFDDETAIFKNIPLSDGFNVDVLEFVSGLGIQTAGMQIYVQSSVGNSINFTAFAETRDR